MQELSLRGKQTFECSCSVPGQDRGLEWPYSTSFGDLEDPSAQGGPSQSCPSQSCPRESDSDYPETHAVENNHGSPFRMEVFRPPPPPPGGERPGGGRRSPLPPPLPPPRQRPQDSPRNTKVSFIFGDPPMDSLNPSNLGYQQLMDESPELADEGRSAFLPSGAGGLRVPDGMAFCKNVVYSNIGEGRIFTGVEGAVEEPLLRDLCYAETTDEVEDEDEGSGEEDSTITEGEGEGEGPEGEAGALSPSSAGNSTFLSLSGSSDDIIDLTSLPPPEGEDNEVSDALLRTLNMAIAAPPPGFRDSSDEEGAEGKGQPPGSCDHDDLPVSLIDAVPTHGESSGSTDRRLDHAVVTTLQALEALAVAEEPARPQRPNSSAGPHTYTVQSYTHAHAHTPYTRTHAHGHTHTHPVCVHNGGTYVLFPPVNQERFTK